MAGDPAGRVGDGQRLAVTFGEPGRHGSGTGDGDLLADDGPYEELVGIDCAGDPHPGTAGHQRRHDRVFTERAIDGGGVRVKIEQAPGQPDGLAVIASIGDVGLDADAAGPFGECRKVHDEHAIAVGESDRSAVAVSVGRLHTGDGSLSQELGERCSIEGRVERLDPFSFSTLDAARLRAHRRVAGPRRPGCR